MQPMALGAAAWAAGLLGRDAALCSLHHLVVAATTAAVRLLGLDPFEVQAMAAGLAPRLDREADSPPRWPRRHRAARDLPASGSLLGDVLAEDHATWEVRLFAS